MENTLQKNPGGRPVAFKTVEELKKKVDEYFDWCDNRTKEVWSEKTKETIVIVHPAPYTMSGLARRVGLSRQGLLNYSKKEKFFDTIRDARQRVEEDIENRLMETRNEKGAIFNLKNNFNWADDKNNTYVQVNSKDMTLNFQ